MHHIVPYMFLVKFEVYEQSCTKHERRLLMLLWKYNDQKFKFKYSETCIRRPLLGSLKSDRFGQVFSFYSHCECFITIKICWNKDLPFRVFWCHSWRLKMFLVTFDFEHTYIKKWCYASGVLSVSLVKLAIKCF